MMAALEVTIRYNKLPGLPQKAKDALGSGNLRAAQRIVKTAQGRARVRTGYMRDHTVARRDGLVGAKATAEAFYSGFLDAGTRYIPADRWFSGAVEQEKSNAASDIRQFVQKALAS